MKGCFNHASESCNKTQCVNNEPTLNKNVGFCCCDEDLCNKDQTWVPIIPEKIPERTLILFFNTFQGSP